MLPQHPSESARLDESARDPDEAARQPLERVSGPSFPLTIKVIATVLVLALIGSGIMALVPLSTEAQGEPLTVAEWGFLAALALVIGSGYVGIITSKTSCDQEHIEQTWLWRKQVKIADISQVKLIYLPGFSWLVVPRLVVRSGYGLTTFQTADPAVLARFKLLAHGA